MIGATHGSLLSEDDARRLGGIVRTPGGHDLMVDNPQGVIAAIKGFGLLPARGETP